MTVVAVILLLALAGHVVPQNSETQIFSFAVIQDDDKKNSSFPLDTCDPTWQTTRDGLIIAAFVLSDLACVVFIIALIAVFITREDCKKQDSSFQLLDIIIL